ncbi:MAG TPA: hypothetical protein VFA46_00015 [Actinomycetes bacterium]|jgi:hypothetical protein|nr:hypothetical protein [Actinomycetes bacterium]
MGAAGSVIEAAKAIRYYLPELLDADRPDEVDHRLLVLLRQEDQGTDVEAQIVDVLMAQKPTWHWAATFVESGLPPGFPQATRGPARLPGMGSPVRARRYVCPVDGLFSWYRQTAREEIPCCKDHPTMRLVPSG